MPLVLLGASCREQMTQADAHAQRPPVALPVAPPRAVSSAVAAEQVAPSQATLSAAAVAQLRENPWSRCFSGFSSSRDSARDVLRLSTLCGPVTGMQPMGPRFSGALDDARASTVRVDFGEECVRLVATADGTIDDLEVELLTPGGESLALLNQGKPWAVLPADKPICLSPEGTYRVELSTHSGAGRYALWVLRYWPSEAEQGSP